jgi:hypothetical protein
LIDHLTEGDPSAYTEVRPALTEVPTEVEAGDVFVTPGASQVVWYEVLDAECQAQIFVKAYSRSLKSGEYDYVRPTQLVARVSRWLFERARVHGFRTVRACN